MDILMRKRIGVLIGEAEAPHCMTLLTGISNEAKRLDFDLFVYTNFNQTMGQERYVRGEGSIYELINFNMLDAVLIVPESLRIPGIARRLEKKVQREFNGPVLCIDYDSEFFPTMKFDDIDLMKRIIHHLTDVHGFTSIAFISGPLHHEHAINRLTAYKEALMERQIPIDESLIFEGTFYYECTGKMADELMKREKLPQAVACANQLMAVDIYDELTKRGLSIPEDIVVTGYDATDRKVKENYYITSTLRTGGALGARAVRYLYEKLYNTVLPEQEDDEDRLLIWNTCGCRPTHEEINIPLDYSIWKNAEINSFENHFLKYNFMMEDLISSENPQECFDRCRTYLPDLGDYSDIYICLNEDWLTKQDTKAIYSGKILVVIQDHKSNIGKVIPVESFPKLQMLPYIEIPREKTMIYYFMPLHFYGIAFGYAVICFEDKPVFFNRNYRHWIHNMDSAIQSQRQEHALHEMYDKLERYAVKDLLTGIYSSNGFELHSMSIYEDAKASEQNLICIVGDVNNLKTINDRYGHEWGDKALRILADALENQIKMKKLKGMAFRTGGDEFNLLLTGAYTEDSVKNIIDEIDDYVEMAKDLYDMPTNVTVSLGGCLSVCTEDKPLSEIIAEADQQMYNQKFIYKSSNRNNVQTRIWNKAYFEAETERIIKENSLCKKYAFISMRIHNYELYLNIYGRQKGNDIIRHLGELVDIHLPEDSIATKYSDRQYVIFFPYTEVSDIENWFLTFNMNIEGYELQTRSDYSMKINSGIYLYKGQGKYTVKDMIERANFALQTGIDDVKGFVVYDERMRDKFIEETEIIRSFDEAMEKNEFQIYLQPQHYIQMKDKVLSAEALVRWIKADGTIIYPNSFIPAFEKNGFIAKLDRHIMELTCKFINTHIEEAWCRDIRIAVNVSKIDLEYEHFLEYYIDTKNKYNIPDGAIEIEFTESAVFEDYNTFKNIMEKLQQSGFSCALDDFGAGSSSLNLLKELPVDVIKMDRLFFKESNNRQRDNSVITSVVAMAKGLGMKIVAEGIEDDERVKFLREIGCDVIQGFIYSKPLSVNNFIDYVSGYMNKLEQY
ncbi:diguanylate cyclase (GGDEF)-like protein [Ruminiclostridium sufflavum DSM 19573]|uniref:Diguanylate cyclase (GGDEF)-like protein n=1 Tax=Ruminiclostridium sufflavum DSM 19573 TaxID=1121337 RepID=A0A318XIV6_9FIRM|nr:EAL domain-containing protein [Ruminiclostridium sufflavum]PYG85628.1 diguanylate cyclase (GGDEF)-like protein [Ruminiclostridium sufflavum DSM 19573]